jgi:hypothetical protein
MRIKERTERPGSTLAASVSCRLQFLEVFKKWLQHLMLPGRGSPKNADLFSKNHTYSALSRPWQQQQQPQPSRTAEF